MLRCGAYGPLSRCGSPHAISKTINTNELSTQIDAQLGDNRVRRHDAATNCNRDVFVGAAHRVALVHSLIECVLSLQPLHTKAL